MTVLIRPMVATDARQIDRQPSQHLQLGLVAEMTPEVAQELIDGGEAWAVTRADEVVALMGIRETFSGVQGVAWAVLARGIGSAHLAVTRFARLRICGSRLRRIEAICLSGIDAERVLKDFPDLDPAQLLSAVLAVPSPETRWAKAAGLTPAHVLRRFGAASETHVLFERVG